RSRQPKAWPGKALSRARSAAAPPDRIGSRETARAVPSHERAQRSGERPPSPLPGPLAAPRGGLFSSADDQARIFAAPKLKRTAARVATHPGFSSTCDQGASAERRPPVDDGTPANMRLAVRSLPSPRWTIVPSVRARLVIIVIG